MAISEMRGAHLHAEGLVLRVADNTTGYFGVYRLTSRPKPYQAKVSRGGKEVHLGSFATAKEAALCVARSPEGQAAARTAAAAVAPLTSEEARQQAQAEGLTLLVAESKTGYFGVKLLPSRPCTGQPKPYLARVSRGGKQVMLGSFATAEEAALCVARSPEGQAAAAERAAAVVPPLTSEEARQQAQAEGLALLVGKNKTGYFGVNLKHPGLPKPYEARVRRGGKKVMLGCFATAEEAALCVARSPEGQAAAKTAAAAVAPLTKEQALQQALAEELTLLVADTKTGYFGVYNSSSKPKPYDAQVTRGGRSVHLGYFATAEEAALCIARSPEGRKAVERSAPPPRRSEEEGQGTAPAMPSRAVLKVESTVPPMPPGAFVKEEVFPLMPPGAFFKEEVVVKREHAFVVDEGGRSEGRPKRRRHT